MQQHAHFVPGSNQFLYVSGNIIILVQTLASNQLGKATDTSALGGKTGKTASRSHQTLLVGTQCTYVSVVCVQLTVVASLHLTNHAWLLLAIFFG